MKEIIFKMSGWFHGRPTLAQVEQARYEQRIRERENLRLQPGRIRAAAAAEQARLVSLAQDRVSRLQFQQYVEDFELEQRNREMEREIMAMDDVPVRSGYVFPFVAQRIANPIRYGHYEWRDRAVVAPQQRDQQRDQQLEDDEEQLALTQKASYFR